MIILTHKGSTEYTHYRCMKNLNRNTGTCNVKAHICFSNFSRKSGKKSASVTLGIRIPSTINMGINTRVSTKRRQQAVWVNCYNSYSLRGWIKSCQRGKNGPQARPKHNELQSVNRQLGTPASPQPNIELCDPLLPLPLQG